MTPQDFIAKWHSVELKELTASQSHFIDLCRLIVSDMDRIRIHTIGHLDF